MVRRESAIVRFGSSAAPRHRISLMAAIACIPVARQRFFQNQNLNVCFHRKRPFGPRNFPHFKRQLTARSGHAATFENGSKVVDYNLGFTPETTTDMANPPITSHSVGELDAELRCELPHAWIVMQKLRLRPLRHLPREPWDLFFFGRLQPFYRRVRVTQSTVN